MGSQLKLGEQIVQQKMYAGAVAIADPTHDIYFVDSVGGNSGNDGITNLHCTSTLVLACAAASAGDTIITDRTGGETLSDTLALAKAGIRIVCPGAEQNPESGYTLTLASDADVISITAADVLINGIKTIHTGETSSSAGIKVGAAAHRATILNSVFDDSAIVTDFTGFGVEVVGGAQDVRIDNCRGRDLLYGVNFVENSTEVTLRPDVTNCKWLVGQANAFGIGASPGTGSVCALHVDNNKFFECDGDGSAATAAWDGANGITATQGPIELGANCDQYIIEHCEAFTALDKSFDLICAVNGGAVGEMIENLAPAGDLSTAVDSVGTQVSTAQSQTTSETTSIGTAVSGAQSQATSEAGSIGTAVSGAQSQATSEAGSIGTAVSGAQSQATSEATSVGTAVSTSTSHVTSVGTAVSSAQSHVTSVGTAVSTAQSQATSEATSIGTAVSGAQSQATSEATSIGTAATSVGTAVTGAQSQATSEATSIGTAVSTVQSHTESVGTAVSGAQSQATSEAGSIGTAVSGAQSQATSEATSVGTAVSTAQSHVTSVGTAVSTAQSQATSETTSLGTQVSTAQSHVTSVGTAVSTAQSHVTSVGTAVTAKGRPIHITKIISDDSIPSNAQSFALFTATGDVLVEDIIFSKDGTLLAAMANVELTCNNAFGLTGLANDLFKNVVAGFAANLTLRASDGGVTPFVPRVVEDTKIIYIHGDDAAGNSGAQIKVTAIAYALTDGASLA